MDADCFAIHAVVTVAAHTFNETRHGGLSSLEVTDAGIFAGTTRGSMM
jgi:hypothetical protein